MAAIPLLNTIPSYSFSTICAVVKGEIVVFPNPENTPTEYAI